MNAWIASGAVAIALVAGFAGGRVSDQSECRPARSEVAANFKAGHDFGYEMAAAADAERRAAQAPPPALLPAPPPSELAVDPAYGASSPSPRAPAETPAEAAERIYREFD